MFNIYEFEKRIQKDDINKSASSKASRRTESLKYRNNVLSEKYKQRIGQFIKKMIAEPAIKNDYQDTDKNFMGSRKYSGEKQFRFTSTCRERAQESQQKNSILDCSPSQLHEGNTLEKIMNLRPRNKEKEIGPPSFRFQAKSTIERVYDSLNGRNTGSIPLNEIANFKTVKQLRATSQIPETARKSMTDNSLILSRRDASSVRPQDICPSLHLKTHFQAATSVFMDHKGSLQDNDKSIQKMLNEYSVKRNLRTLIQRDESTFVPNKSQNSRGLQPINYYSNNIDKSPFQTRRLSIKQLEQDSNLRPSEITKQMLLTCNVMRKKNQQALPLKPSTVQQRSAMAKNEQRLWQPQEASKFDKSIMRKTSPLNRSIL